LQAGPRPAPPPPRPASRFTAPRRAEVAGAEISKLPRAAPGDASAERSTAGPTRAHRDPRSLLVAASLPPPRSATSHGSRSASPMSISSTCALSRAPGERLTLPPRAWRAASRGRVGRRRADPDRRPATGPAAPRLCAGRGVGTSDRHRPRSASAAAQLLPASPPECTLPARAVHFGHGDRSRAPRGAQDAGR
jgi:hypothetical protein